MVPSRELYCGVGGTEARRWYLAFVPGGLLFRRLAPARPLAHVGVTDVEVCNHPVTPFQAEELAHAIVVGDGAGAPHRSEAEGVGGKLHVLHSGGAGGVVL